MDQKVRVRFAPSPTGPLHIGGVRTALFNYLFAKQQQGDFILRIEDTDQNRFVEGAEDYITETLDWLNIPCDEGPRQGGDYGPYRQSERKDLYKDYAMQLIDEGKAYYAFDTADELNGLRQKAEANGETFIYNWSNRQELNNSLSLSDKEGAQRLSDNVPYVIRFMSPVNRNLSFNDIIRGEVNIDTNTLDDKVLFKSDGMPTYHLANIVDDHLMAITHVIRGEEWLPSLALHVLLYEAFDWTPPQFAHLPLIMKPVGKGKLSKRDGEKLGFPVFPLEWKTAGGERYAGYREDGYLPQAVVNMLALLGWNPGTDQEIFSLDELVRDFELSKVHKGGAKFDPDKAKWFQHQYMQQLPDEELVKEFKAWLDDKGVRYTVNVGDIVKSLKERITFISELWAEGHFFFEAPGDYDPKAAGKAFGPETPVLMRELIDLLEAQQDFSATALSQKVKPWIGEKGVGFGKVMMPLRLSLVGSMKGPDVFEIAAILGREETCSRLSSALAYMG
jgi:glutamyl-tRNA synthetase